MRNLINNIKKNDFIYYKNLCITNKQNRDFNKFYKKNLNFKNNIDNSKINFNNIDENVSELQYLEQIYDCIDDRESINEKINK
jgi:hypothetical protein